MKIIWSVLCLLLTFGVIKGQVDESRKFIYLLNDSVVYGKYVDLHNPIFGSSYISIDDVKVKSKRIKFFNGSEGFYANISSADNLNKPLFAERIKKGDINLYEYYRETYNASTGSFGGGGSISYSKYYFNKGFGDVKKANYENLVGYMSDNELSRRYLTKSKKLKNTQAAMFGGGLLVALISLSSISNSSNETIPMITTGLGVVCFYAAFYLPISDNIEKAIDAYNK
jgi:hypothetical protein